MAYGVLFYISAHAADGDGDRAVAVIWNSAELDFLLKRHCFLK